AQTEALDTEAESDGDQDDPEPLGVELLIAVPGQPGVFPSAVRSWRSRAERARPLAGLMCAAYGAYERAHD
ncbi:hypothetical protein ABZV29_28090, partial [Streptomyces sp. NPDC005236]|uniref:hypothetical protein n=1 Tax=Streptomyces sp. NPDC005236 TaxID=3157028 RepID=UPI0033B9CFAC